MKLGRFRLGMRTIKTAIAVMLCILLFHFLDRGQPLIAALSALFWEVTGIRKYDRRRYSYFLLFDEAIFSK